MRVPDGKVTDSCGYRPALSAGWRGTRPCACDPRKEALNCDRRGATALRAAARLQGFSEDLPVDIDEFIFIKKHKKFDKDTRDNFKLEEKKKIRNLE